MKNSLSQSRRVLRTVLSTVLLLATSGLISAYNPFDSTPEKAALPTRPPVTKGKEVGKTTKFRPTESPLKRVAKDRSPKVAAATGNDPVRFTIASSKRSVTANEPIEIVITAELLDIPSSLMFFTEEATAFRLKVLPPAGFVTTGGTYRDMVGEKLTLTGKPTATYTLQGYFEATAPSMCFRLLRGGGQADNNSLFIEKASVCLQGAGNQAARVAALTYSPVITPLNATTGDCSGITLSASASPATLNTGGQVTLSASCAGCGSGTGFNSGQALVYDGVDDQLESVGVYTGINSTFTWEAWVKPLQPLTGNKLNEQYALFPAHGGNGGSVTGVGVAVGTNGIQVYEHTDDYLETQLIHNQTVSGWTHIAVVYTNAIPSLYVNGQFIKSGNASGRTPKPSMNLGGDVYGHFQGSIDEARIWNVARTQAQILASYQQIVSSSESGLVAYWRFEETGNTIINSVTGGPLPTNWPLKNGTGRGTGVIIGSNNTTAYSWQALEGGSSIANPNAASTQVTVPSTAGNYAYRVTLTSGSCLATQDVGIVVTSPSGSGSGDCFVISNKQSGQFIQATTGNTVEHVAQASGLANQVWKFETMADGKLRISSTNGSDNFMYVNSYSNDQQILLGADMPNENRYRWTKELISGSYYRVRSGVMPWTQQYAGTLPELQIWGDVTVPPQSNNPNYIQFNFQSVGCPGGVPNMLTVNPSSIPNVAANGLTQTITVSSNITWNIISADPWVTVSPASGSNNGAFSITVQPNSSLARSTNITVSGGGITRTIPISQLGTTVGGALISGNCYVIKSLQTTSTNNTLQPTAANTVNHQVANGQENQIWKAESAGSQYRFTVQSGNRDQSLYVDSFGNTQLLRVGSYVNDERYRWSLVASSSGGFRVYGGSAQNTWDQAGAGWGQDLQLYGNETDQSDGSWNQSYRRFSFTPATCPTSSTICTPPTLSLQSPICNGTSTYTVPFTVTGGASIAVTPSVGTVSSNQITNIPVGTNITVTATLNSCQSQAVTVNAPTCSSTGDPFVDHQLATKRYLGPTYYMNDKESNGSFRNVDKESMAWSATDCHANYAWLTVNWNLHEKTLDTYDWTMIDSAMEKVAQLNATVPQGYKAMLRLNFNRNDNEANINDFIPPADRVRDQNQNELLVGATYMGSFDSDDFVNHVLRFTQALFTHIKNKPTANYAHLIMGASVVTNPGLEGGYTWINQAPGSSPDALYDFSPKSLEKFKARMAAKYGTIGVANAAWNKAFANFAAISFDIPPHFGGANWSFNTPFLRDIYEHRQDGIAALTNQFTTVINSFSGNLKTVFEDGSLHDNLSVARGSAGKLRQKLLIKGVKVNNAPDAGYPTRLTTSLALDDWASDKFACDEIFGAQDGTTNQLHPISGLIGQAVGSYQAGVTIIDYAAPHGGAGWDGTPELRAQGRARMKEIFDGIHAQTPIGVTVSRSVPTTQFTTSQLEILTYYWINGRPNNQPPLISVFNSLTNGGTQNVRVIINDN